MSQNERTRAQISATIADIEQIQATLPPELIAYDPNSNDGEAYEIVRRIMRRLDREARKTA